MSIPIARVAEALSEHDDALVAGFDCEAFEKAQKEMTWASSFKYKHLCEEGYPSLVLFPKLYVESQGYGDDVDNEKMKVRDIVLRLPFPRVSAN